MTRLIAVTIALLLATAAYAKVITETDILCDQELHAEPVNADTANLFVECVTVDSTGTVVRSKRTYNVWNRLTSQQKTGVLNILSNLKSYAAQNESVPTPTPKPTSTP